MKVVIKATSVNFATVNDLDVLEPKIGMKEEPWSVSTVLPNRYLTTAA